MNPGVPTVYVIAGPTAVGKTAVAIELAKQLGTAIVSADSRQCYKEMVIGTATPSDEELAQVKHYFINEFSVAQPLTAADYESLALGYLREIFQTTNTAIVSGGTGLYIKALCTGLDEMPTINEQIAQQVNNSYLANGLAWLQDKVAMEDGEFYKQGEIQNPARLLRALIFKRSTGRSIVHFRLGGRKKRDFHIVKVGLELPRDILYGRIDGRVDIMMQHGLLAEVETLYPLRHLKNLQTVGYTELFTYLDGNCKLDEAIARIKQNTRHYGKRQMTWFKKDKEINWLSADDKDVVEKIIGLK